MSENARANATSSSTRVVVAVAMATTGIGFPLSVHAQTPSVLPPVTVTSPEKRAAAPAKRGSMPTRAAVRRPARGEASPSQPSAQRPALAGAGKQGAAAEGYRVNDVMLGMLGERNIRDIPFSANVVSSDFMKDRQVNGLADALKYYPSVQISDYGNGGGGPSGGQGRLQTRGFVSDAIRNTRIDGMTAFIVPVAPEGYGRLEILNGLTGSLYGVANPAGTFNLVQKRPTLERGGEILSSYRRDAVGQAFIDVNSGLIGDKALGTGVAARLTSLYQDGEGWVPDSRFGRQFGSLALDWRISPQTTLETNVTHSKSVEKGYAGQFLYSQNALGIASVGLPDPIDPTKKGYGQSYHLGTSQVDTVTGRLTHQINDDWKVSASALYMYFTSYLPRYFHTFTNNAGDYTSRLSMQPVTDFRIWSNSVFITGKFDTYGVGHEITLGTNGQTIDTLFMNTVPSVVVGNSNINSPTVYPYFPFPSKSSLYTGTTGTAQNLVMSDTITFNKYWGVMLTGNQAWIDNEVIRSPFAASGTYKDSGFSYSASLMFKPVENVTTYITRASSLQEGEIAPGNATNSGVPIAPYRSEQYEAGVKVSVSKIDVGAALFRIERPFAAVDLDGTYRIIGNQVNRGFEVFSSGRVGEYTTVMAGVTLLDPRLNDTNIATTSGKDVVNIPRVAANLLIEYDLPQIPGLTVGANVRHTGRRAADNANTVYLDSFTTLDLNARYTTLVWGYETTFRLNINNVTNENYWASVLPANLIGSAAGTYALTPGKPFDVFASASVKF